MNIGEVEDVECAMKRNIIHLLCLQPMSHSELVKLLPDDVCPAVYHKLYGQLVFQTAESLPLLCYS